MEAKTNYTVVGIFVIVMGVAVIACGLWLSVGFQKKVYQTYALVMNEPVSGLSVQSSVKFNGVSVGYVKAINLNHDDPQQVDLLLNIEQGTPVTVSTYARLMSQGITGITYIGLRAESPTEQILQKHANEPYPVIPAKPSLLVQLDSAIRDASKSLTAITESVKSVLSQENADALFRILNHLDTFSTVLARRSNTLGTTIKNANILMKNSAKASAALPEVMEKIKQSANRFDLLGRELQVAANEAAKTMKASRKVVNKVSRQALPPAVALIDKLHAVADNMASLSKELKKNPAMLIRGKARPSLGPGER